MFCCRIFRAFGLGFISLVVLLMLLLNVVVVTLLLPALLQDLAQGLMYGDGPVPYLLTSAAGGLDDEGEGGMGGGAIMRFHFKLGDIREKWLSQKM